MQLLLQFYSDFLETLQVFLCYSFSQIEFSRFLGVYYYQDINVLETQIKSFSVLCTLSV